MDARDRLRGVYAPITTPFGADEMVDYAGLERNMAVYAASGIDGYLALGSNGENKSLFGDEKSNVLRCIVKNKARHQKVMAGCIAESTRETILLAKMAEAEGADFVTLLPPCYFAKQMTDEALEQYFCDVADSVSIPVLVYCAPQFSAGLVLSQSLVQAVARHPNIVGMKDSSGGNIDGYLEAAPPTFAVMAGSANIFVHALERGATGGVVSLANSFPAFCAELYRVYQTGDKAAYGALNEKMLRLNKGIAGKGAVAAVKYAMDLAGLAGGAPRKPLLPLPNTMRGEIKSLLQEEGMIGQNA